MPKVKNLAYPAVAGFALSFFISILVTHRFGASLLKGLVFGLAFAVLAFVIDFVWGRFLGEGEDAVEISSEAPKGDKNLGNKVDITIDDADLSDDGRGLPFAVDRNRAKLSDADTLDLRKNDVMFTAETKGEQKSLFEASSTPQAKPAEPAAAAAAPAPSSASPAPAASAAPAAASGAADSFKPVSLGKPIAAAGSSSPSPAQPAAASGGDKSQPSAAKKGGGEMASLPDISGFDDENNYVSEADIEASGPSDISSSDSSSSTPVLSGNASKATGHDVETLAKAISTVLKRDEVS